MKIAFLTAGGLAPCLSASIGRLIEQYYSRFPKAEMIGYLNGYKGLLLGNSITIPEQVKNNAQILYNFGGSPIGNSRVKLTNINDCIKKYKSFEIFINLDTLTISAVERHRNVIIGFAEYGQLNGYEKYLTNMELSNTPSFITTTTSILSSFISPKVTELVKIHKKER